MKNNNIFKRQQLNNNNDSMQDLKYNWFNIYKSKPKWADYYYRSAFGVKKKRPLSRLNLPKTITEGINSLLFSETPTIKTNEYIEEIFKNNDFLTNLKKWYEYVNALGGGALKIYVKNGETTIDFVKAQNFVPVNFNNTMITDADFYSDEIYNGEKYTIIEQHRIKETGYEITTLVYNASGSEVQLSDIGRSEEKTIEFSNITHPLFVYCPSVVTNNLNSESPENISLFANSEHVLHECDNSFDALNSEVRLGRKRLIVGSGMIQKSYDEDGNLVNYVDPSDEIFTALNSDDIERLQVMDNSSGQLRITDLTNSLNVNLKLLSMSMGFDANFLSFDAVGGLKTATEIISDNSATFRRISLMKRSLEKCINDLCRVIMIYKSSLDGGISYVDEDFVIKFEDNIIEDRNSKTAYWHGRLLNKTATLEDVLIHLDGLSAEDAKKKADELREVNKTVTPPNMFE